MKEPKTEQWVEELSNLSFEVGKTKQWVDVEHFIRQLLSQTRKEAIQERDSRWKLQVQDLKDHFVEDLDQALRERAEEIIEELEKAEVVRKGGLFNGNEPIKLEQDQYVWQRIKESLIEHLNSKFLNHK